MNRLTLNFDNTDDPWTLIFDNDYVYFFAHLDNDHNFLTKETKEITDIHTQADGQSYEAEYTTRLHKWI